MASSLLRTVPAVLRTVPAVLGLGLAGIAFGQEYLAAEPRSSAALVLERGSVARSQVVALRRDLIIDGECLRGAAVVGGSARVRGSVKGDLVVLGGAAQLETGARIEGDVYVLGGTLGTAPDVEIGGRAVAYPTVPSTWLVLLEGPSIGLRALSPFVVGAKLGLLAAWLAATLLLVWVSGREVRATAALVRREPFRSFFSGLTGALALVLTLVFLSAFAAAVVGVPLVVLAVLAALLLKLWGTVAVFLALGTALLVRVGRTHELPLTAALLGLSVLGLLKVVPLLGVWVWTVVTLIGVGATLSSKFGRLEAWTEEAALPS